MSRAEVGRPSSLLTLKVDTDVGKGENKEPVTSIFFPLLKWE